MTDDELIQLLRDTDPDAMQARWAHDDKLLRRALHLAPDLETFEALRRGETVPLSRLDPIAVARFGRKA